MSMVEAPKRAHELFVGHHPDLLEQALGPVGVVEAPKRMRGLFDGDHPTCPNGRGVR
jgi:hypothetical protein